MLSYVNLKNFKCFDEQDFALGNLTLIAGANGAGKSTILKSITRQLEIIGGEVIKDLINYKKEG